MSGLQTFLGGRKKIWKEEPFHLVSNSLSSYNIMGWFISLNCLLRICMLHWHHCKNIYSLFKCMSFFPNEMYIYTEGMHPCFEFWHRRKKLTSVVWQGKCPCNVNCLFWVFLPRELMSGGELCKIRSVSALGTGAMTQQHQPAAWSRRL